MRKISSRPGNSSLFFHAVKFGQKTKKDPSVKDFQSDTIGDNALNEGQRDGSMLVYVEAPEYNAKLFCL